MWLIYMQVWLNIESYVFFNLLSKFEEKSHNIADHIISVISIDTAPCIVRDLKGNFFVRLDKFWIISLLCKVTLGFFQWLLWYPMGLPSIPKIRKTILQQTSWAGWQHPDDKRSEAVLDPLPFSGLESYHIWWWTHIDVLQ